MDIDEKFESDFGSAFAIKVKTCKRPSPRELIRLMGVNIIPATVPVRLSIFSGADEAAAIARDIVTAFANNKRT